MPDELRADASVSTRQQIGVIAGLLGVPLE